MLAHAKKIVITTCLLLLLVLGGCASKDDLYEVNNKDYIILRLAESQPASYPSAQGDVEFARLVEEKSGGRIMVTSSVASFRVTDTPCGMNRSICL